MIKISTITKVLTKTQHLIIVLIYLLKANALIEEFTDFIYSYEAKQINVYLHVSQK